MTAAPWIDAETKLEDAPADHKDELRLWLRLLTCSTLIETEIRRRLAERHNFSLPRFDLLAQLDRAPEGLVLGEVSRRLMVSAGNVTSLVDGLVESGHITRAPSQNDKRVQIIRLTERGERDFRQMAADHETWIAGLLADLDAREIRRLLTGLSALKDSVRAGLNKAGAS